MPAHCCVPLVCTDVVCSATVAESELEPPTVCALWNVIDRTELIWFWNAEYPPSWFRRFGSASAQASEYRCAAAAS